ncbi:MAG: YeeE/YedE family protein [Spirochaetaceae bacterium]|jgi:uncharacterized membrane protein YedE/YeeE|nr:YeeE/YedE family protein [Spirochaetaceae bacterium]
MEKNKTNYYAILCKNEWSYTTGAVIMALLAVSMAAFGGAWGIVGPFAIWGGKTLALFSANADSWKIFNGQLSKYSFLNNQGSITDIALIFGALISCLLASQWKLRMIKSTRQVWAAVVGGLLMGIGTRIAPACNIGAMFSSIPQFSLSGWIYLVCAVAGAVVGGKMLVRWFIPPVSHERRTPRKKLSEAEHKRNRRIQIAAAMLLLVLGFIAAYAAKAQAPLAGIFIFVGLGLGYAIQRSRFCFTAAMRDPALTGSTKVTKALIAALAVSTIMFTGIHIARYGIDLAKLPETIPGGNVALHLPIGSFLFGIGAAIAGCCASGTFIRIGEGYVQSMITFVFFIAGSLPGAWLMQNVVKPNPLLSSGKAIYLPKLFGGFGPALLIQLLLLLALWIIADHWEKRAMRNEQRTENRE